MYEIFEQLLQKYGITAYKVSKDTGIAQSTLSSWKTKRNDIGSENAKILADYFGVTVDYLLTGKEGNKDVSLEIELTKSDSKQVDRILAYTERLLKQEGLIFDGNPASEESIESIIAAMQVGLEMAKKKNKEKYTPKKYKKD